MSNNGHETDHLLQGNNGGKPGHMHHGRSKSLSGGDIFGSFRFKDGPNMSRSYSMGRNVGSAGIHQTIGAKDLGIQELYLDIPFTAVHGMQKHQRTLSKAFALSAAEFDINEHPNLSREEKKSRLSTASMILLQEIQFESNVVTIPLICATLISSISTFLVGYNTGVMNAPSHIVFPDHSTFLWSLAVAAFAVGGPFGSIVGGTLADQRGRRGALLLSIWIFLLGGSLQTFAHDMFTIIIARFMIGFASGYSTVLVPIYLGEMAPPTLRGMLGTLTQFALVIGILVANLIAFPTVRRGNWRLLFSITPMIALVQLMMASFLLESPRWLLNRDPDSPKARYIIKQLRGLRYDHEVEQEVGNFLMGSDKQRVDNETSSQYDIVKEMWDKPKIRKLLISSLILQVSQQLCGINAVFYYSTSFFEGILPNPLVGTTIVCTVNVVATYLALLLMDRCGRRTLILWSSAGMFLSCIIIVLSLLGYFSHIIALVAVNAFVTFFEFGLGPIPWLIVAEMFEGKYVAVAMSMSSQLNWACNFVIGLVFPFFVQYLGPYSFAPFACVLAGCFLFAATILPETQGTTPEQLAAELTRTLSQNVLYEPNPTTELSSAVANPIDDEWRKAMEQLQQEEEIEQRKGTYDYGFEPINDGEEYTIP